MGVRPIWDLSYTAKTGNIDEEINQALGRGYSSVSLDIYQSALGAFLAIKNGRQWGAFDSSKAHGRVLLELPLDLIKVFIDPTHTPVPIDPTIRTAVKRTSSSENPLNHLRLRLDTFRSLDGEINLYKVQTFARFLVKKGDTRRMTVSTRYPSIAKVLAEEGFLGSVAMVNIFDVAKKWRYVPERKRFRVRNNYRFRPTDASNAALKSVSSWVRDLHAKHRTRLVAEVTSEELTSLTNYPRFLRSSGFAAIDVAPKTTGWTDLRSAVVLIGKTPSSERWLPENVVSTESVYQVCRSLYAATNPKVSYGNTSIPWDMDLRLKLAAKQQDAIKNFSYFSLTGDAKALPSVAGFSAALTRQLGEIKSNTVGTRYQQISLSEPVLEKVVISTIENEL